MFAQLQFHNLPFHQQQRPVFLSSQRQKKVNCNIFDILQHKGLLPCSQEEKLKQHTPRQSHKTHDMNATKLSKKSLKSHSKFNEFFQNTVKKEQSQMKEFQQKTDKKIAEKIHKFSRHPSKIFSKTTSSELDFKIIQKPATINYKVFRPTHQSQKCSSQNLVNSSGRFSQSCKLEQNRLSHIAMVQSISKNNVQLLMGNKQQKLSNPLMNPEAILKLKNAKIVNSISQGFDILGISPVKQIIIPEVSQRSGFNECQSKRKNRQLKAPPQIRKTISGSYSQFLKSSQNNQLDDSIKSSIPIRILTQQRQISDILIYDQQETKLKASKREFLEVSLQKEQNIQGLKKSQIQREYIQRDTNQGENAQSQISCKKSQIYQEQQRSVEFKNNIISRSNTSQEASGKQAQIQQIHSVFQQQQKNSRQMLNDVLQNSSDSNKEIPHQSQYGVTEPNNQIPILKAPKLHHLPFARHSVQIPRSKKFSVLKVRRTISMRDQEQSDEQETSEVVYGFRNTHKEAIIEDVNEEMQQSCVTRIEKNAGNSINLSQFHQLLR